MISIDRIADRKARFDANGCQKQGCAKGPGNSGNVAESDSDAANHHEKDERNERPVGADCRDRYKQSGSHGTRNRTADETQPDWPRPTLPLDCLRCVGSQARTGCPRKRGQSVCPEANPQEAAAGEIRKRLVLIERLARWRCSRA